MEKEILNMEEAADLFSVSVKTFIKLLKEEKIPARKIGREWRFSRKALIEWLSSGDSQSYSSSEGETKEFFNEVAPRWEEIRKNYYDESIKTRLIGLNILKKDMTVVDLGAGDGYLTRGIAGYVKKVIAVDISGEMLKTLARKAKEAGLSNIDAVEADCLELPFAEGTVDMICASMLLHHIDEPGAALREMHRVIKPEGRIFLADFMEYDDPGMKEAMHDVWAGFKPDSVLEWFEKAGFKIINMEASAGNDKPGLKLKVFIITAEK